MTRQSPLVPLLVLGALAFVVAGLSIVDMFVPRPYDGIVLQPDSPHQLEVRSVVAGSGADAAGVMPGDVVVGIDRSALRSLVGPGRRTGWRGRTVLQQAAELVNRRQIGDRVPYLLRRGDRVLEVELALGPRTVGSPAYLLACLLGFAFFFVGLFVVLRQPRARAAWVFYAMSSLFLLFLVCRLRPASYSWVDHFVLTTGTAALVFLPATFLHFFLVFPRPFHLSREGRALPFGLSGRAWASVLAVAYLLPLAVYAVVWLDAQRAARPRLLISGAPAANWWVLAAYLVLGLLAVSLHSRRIPDPRQRRGAALVSLGAVFGLVPFIVLAVVFPSVLHTEDFLFLGVLPLALVPATFAYAIVRYELLDIRVIVRKSLLYTATSALVTAFYALGIGFFNVLFRGTSLASSWFFPVLLALAIVFLFEPLRRRIQGPIDRFFFAGRQRLERAIRQLGEAFTARVDLQEVVRDLVDRLPSVLDVSFAGLYLRQGGELVRQAGPESLPARLPVVGGLSDRLRRSRGLAGLEELPFGQASVATGGAGAALGWPATSSAGLEIGLDVLIASLSEAGVAMVGDLVSRNKSVGVIVLGPRSGQLALEPEEVELLAGLLGQAAIALDTSLLVEERTHQAELEREIEIAADIQRSLIPTHFASVSGWKVAGVCKPARHVGGDFFVELPSNGDASRRSLAFGDVSGKSVSGALMMMAAHEVLYALALSGHEPATLLDLANDRLYRLGKRSFVALGLFSFAADDGELRYLLAGQPQPLHRTPDGRVVELALPAHRLPLGALLGGHYQTQRASVRSGDLVLGYSDGVVEATSPSGELFGLDRLTELLRQIPPEPQLVVDRVLSALDDFTGGAEPYDDVTLVAIGRQQETMYA